MNLGSPQSRNTRNTHTELPIATELVGAQPANVRPGRDPTLTGRSHVSPGLLGIASGDSSGSDDEDDDAGKPSFAGVSTGTTPSPAPASAAPEGLPAGFFDEDVAPSESVLPGEHEAARNEPEEVAVGFGPERAAQLAAEAEAEAEADAAREAERLAALRAAGVVLTVVPATAAAAVDGEMDADEAGTGAAAPNGSALPEGFFDDPEVDAKTRGVDLKAKKKEEEQ